MEPGNQNIIVSRDVVFLEDQMPCFKRSKAASETGKPENNCFEVEPEPGLEVDDATAVTDSDIISEQGGISGQQAGNLDNYLLARDRVRRTGTRLPARYADSEMLFFALHVAEQLEHSEPATYSEAVNGPEKEKWIKAMKEEFDSLIRNKTWILVDKDVMRRIISCKWIYKKKIEAADQV